MITTASTRRALTLALTLAALLAAGWGGAQAAVTFEVDRETLNEVLAELTLDQVAVPLTASRSLLVRLRDMKVTGFDPTAGAHGQILTSVRLEAPDIGLNISTSPRLSLNVIEQATGTLLEMRFEKVTLDLPLAGSVNVAPLLPPLRYPTDNVWILAGTRGDVPVTSRLDRVVMGRNAIRFVFEVEVVVEQQEPAPGIRLTP
jgi:hypothetical protein